MFAASGTGYGMTISGPRIVNTITSTVTPTVFDDFEVHVFTGSGSISFSLDAVVQFLVVGGGGGSSLYGGGGGAGGFLAGEFTALSNSTYTITVGQGGARGSTSGSNGGNSSISGTGITTITSYGGGAGGVYMGSGGTSNGSGGGSGGGAADTTGGLIYGGKGVYPGSAIGGTYNTTVRQGYDGGSTYAVGGSGPAGGGGGAGGPGIGGLDATISPYGDTYTGLLTSGNGGPGAISNITNTDVYYAGGGGGAAYGESQKGGIGGGGDYGQNGTGNTGGGGGGNASGGSGIVIIRYQYQVPGITITNGVPAAPQNLTVTDAYNQAATISYTAPVHNGGKSITSYTLTVSPSISSSPITTTDNPISVTGLTNGVSYTFSLVANNSIGSGPAAVTAAQPVQFVSALATGGTVETFGNYKIHTFTGTDTFTFTILDSSIASTFTVDYVVVAGGGGAANRGAGGAGGYLTGTLSGWAVATSYTMTVGAGGVGYANGVNSSISGTGITTKTAIGGGKGAVDSAGGYSGIGGSGGGGGQSGYSVQGGNYGTAGQGNAGGNGGGSGGGGGGGAGGVGGSSYFNTGVSPNVRTAGNGGVGVVNPIVDSTTGELYNGQYYLAGGGGGALSYFSDYARVSGSGGLGGGGAGGNTNGTAGTDNTGGGGGGAVTTGGNGGSGVIILKYRYLA